MSMHGQALGAILMPGAGTSMRYAHPYITTPQQMKHW